MPSVPYEPIKPKSTPEPKRSTKAWETRKRRRPTTRRDADTASPEELLTAEQIIDGLLAGTQAAEGNPKP